MKPDRYQSIGLTIRGAEINRDVPAFDVTRVFQGLPKRRHQVKVKGLAVEKSHHRHRRLPRACCERPRRRAAKQRDELAPFHPRAHSMTSSARPSRDSFKLILHFFRCATWGVRHDTSSPTLAVRLASIHPFAVSRIERILIPFVRPIAERIAKPWSLRLEGRQA